MLNRDDEVFGCERRVTGVKTMRREFWRRLKRAIGVTEPRVTINRRELLARALGASAWLVSSAMANGVQTKTRPGRIAVVGAGFGGLAAAYELKCAGYDVCLFESRERVGGRVVSFRDLVPDSVVEGGGEFVGKNHPLWLAYAQKFKLPLTELIDEAEPTAEAGPSTKIMLKGKTLSEEEARQVHAEMEIGHAALSAESAPIKTDRPWESEMAAELDRVSLSQRISDLNISETARQGIYTEFLHDMALAPEQMSLLGILAVIKAHGEADYWDETEAFCCELGNQQLAFTLAKELGNRIHLCEPAVRIEHSDRGCRVTTTNCNWECDDVVLAVPPSVWKRITFSPDLPDMLRPQMGKVVKYLAALKQAFWKQTDGSPELLCDSLLGMVWETASSTKDSVPVGLASFSGGTVAESIHKMVPDQRLAKYRSDLETFLPGFRSNLLNDRFMDWPADQWLQGGYAFPKPGDVTTQWPMLQNGLGRLHFAGEHAGLGFIGFMEGGLVSGASVARRLAERDGLVKS